MLEEILAILYRPITDRLEALMADAKQVLQDVKSLKAEVFARLDAIDDVIERGNVDQATLDQISQEVAGARQAVQAVNPEDPSGDNPVAPKPPAQT